MFLEDFRNKKRLGQNFIYDLAFLDGIVNKLGLTQTDTVVEVGAGTGTLTKCLAKRVGWVITYEIDTELEPVLKENLKEFNNIEFRFQDVMDAKDFPSKFKLVANIPYYITTPLIMKFLRERRCSEICILVQEDVAYRIVAVPNTKDYGALSVTCQAFADCKIIKKVRRGMFHPAPSVDSAFIVLKKHEQYYYLPNFDDLLKTVFSKRRKKISNSVDIKLLKKCNIDPNLRPENLTVEQFVKLSQTFS